MNLRPLRVALIAGLLALIAAVVVIAIGAIRVAPTGLGEQREWTLMYLLILGFPTTLAVGSLRGLLGVAVAGPALVMLAIVFAVALNWAGLAGVCWWIICRVRRG
jgi:hypothetical protein